MNGGQTPPDRTPRTAPLRTEPSWEDITPFWLSRQLLLFSRPLARAYPPTSSPVPSRMPIHPLGNRSSSDCEPDSISIGPSACLPTSPPSPHPSCTSPIRLPPSPLRPPAFCSPEPRIINIIAHLLIRIPQNQSASLSIFLPTDRPARPPAVPPIRPSVHPSAYTYHHF